MAIRTMVKLTLAVLIVSIVVAFPPFTLLAQEMMSPDPADLILRNGLIYTVDATNTMTEAVAIRGGKFVFVGSNKDVTRYRGKQTRVIDLKGQFVLPGFNDNHVHFASAAQFLEFNIMRAATQQEFVARVRDVVARLPKGEWILGGYWGAYDQWAAGSPGGARAHDPVDMTLERTQPNPFVSRADLDSAIGHLLPTFKTGPEVNAHG